VIAIMELHSCAFAEGAAIPSLHLLASATLVGSRRKR